MAEPLKMEVATPGFFSVPLRKVEIETNAGTGRTYFLLKGQIIGVAKRAEREDSDGIAA